MITADRIKKLHDKYLELIRLETLEFGVKPTEVRHLIGRLGEFHCALQVGGKLAHLTNQHGFDVVCSNGRRISVKTTAQASGFVSISKSTLDRVDDLMVVQFIDGNISTVYFGPVEAAVTISRFYEPSGCYELDISKARRLTAASTEQADKFLVGFEGGAVYTAERNGQYLVIIDETAALDMLDAEDRHGIDAVKELPFPSAAARDQYIKMRGWSGAV